MSGSGLVEFLRARMAELQATAQRVDLTPDTGLYQERQPDGRYGLVSPETARFYVMRVRTSGIDGMPKHKADGPATELFRLVDPAYVLADIEAKRRIIEEIEKTLLRLEWTGMYSVREEGRLLLKLLALPFKDHPDWQEDWNV